jgi:murein DD-endopeptidase MepM/ murein hydrolase activator NlpD
VANQDEVLTALKRLATSLQKLARVPNPTTKRGGAFPRLQVDTDKIGRTLDSAADRLQSLGKGLSGMRAAIPASQADVPDAPLDKTLLTNLGRTYNRIQSADLQFDRNVKRFEGLDDTLLGLDQELAGIKRTGAVFGDLPDVRYVEGLMKQLDGLQEDLRAILIESGQTDGKQNELTATQQAAFDVIYARCQRLSEAVDTSISKLGQAARTFKDVVKGGDVNTGKMLRQFGKEIGESFKAFTVRRPLEAVRLLREARKTYSGFKTMDKVRKEAETLMDAEAKRKKAEAKPVKPDSGLMGMMNRFDSLLTSGLLAAGPVGFIIGGLAFAMAEAIQVFLDRLQKDADQNRDINESGGLLILSMSGMGEDRALAVEKLKMELADNMDITMALPKRYEIYKASTQAGLNALDMKAAADGELTDWLTLVQRVSWNMQQEGSEASETLVGLVRDFGLYGDQLKERLTSLETYIEASHMVPQEFMKEVMREAEDFSLYGDRMTDVASVMARLSTSTAMSQRQIKDSMDFVFVKPTDGQHHKEAAMFYLMGEKASKEVFDNAIKELRDGATKGNPNAQANADYLETVSKQAFADKRFRADVLGDLFGRLPQQMQMAVRLQAINKTTGGNYNAGNLDRMSRYDREVTKALNGFDDAKLENFQLVGKALGNTETMETGLKQLMKTYGGQDPGMADVDKATASIHEALGTRMETQFEQMWHLIRGMTYNFFNIEWGRVFLDYLKVANPVLWAVAKAYQWATGVGSKSDSLRARDEFMASMATGDQEVMSAAEAYRTGDEGQGGGWQGSQTGEPVQLGAAGSFRLHDLHVNDARQTENAGDRKLAAWFGGRVSGIAGQWRPGGSQASGWKAYAHEGMDIGVRLGAPVKAMLRSQGGVVERIATSYAYRDGTGKQVTLRDNETGKYVTYFHFSKIAPGLRPGMPVKAGDIIGQAGETGVEGNGVHIHVQVKTVDGRGGKYIDPTEFFNLLSAVKGPGPVAAPAAAPKVPTPSAPPPAATAPRSTPAAGRRKVIMPPYNGLTPANRKAILDLLGVGATSRGQRVVAEAERHIGKNVDQMRALIAGQHKGTFHDRTNGPSNAWCGDFAKYVLKQAGIERPELLQSAPDAVKWFERMGRAYKENPVPGDVVIFDFPDRPGTADHVGLVSKNLGGGRFETIEGNTSGRGGPSSVERKIRYMSQVRTFGRVI